MTALEWDNVGERFFETGVDRCVLYIPNGENSPGVAWSGVTGIEESPGGSSTPYFLDGVKYLDAEVFGQFSGSIRAFTYPDEFEQFIGIDTDGGGLLFDDQPHKYFHLSYRTKIGNDVDGVDHGYKIHILWNVLATPDAVTHETLGASTEPVEFSWSIVAQPPLLVGARPTAHLILDSTDLPAGFLSQIEDMLYGTSTTDAYLTSLQDLLDQLALSIVDNGDGTWTIITLSDDDITWVSPTQFEINDIDATYLDADTYTMNTIP